MQNITDNTASISEAIAIVNNYNHQEHMQLRRQRIENEMVNINLNTLPPYPPQISDAAGPLCYSIGRTSFSREQLRDLISTGGSLPMQNGDMYGFTSYYACVDLNPQFRFYVRKTRNNRRFGNENNDVEENNSETITETVTEADITVADFLSTIVLINDYDPRPAQ